MTAPSRSESSRAKRPCACTVAVEHRVGDADPAAVRTNVDILEPRDELGDRPLDRDQVVGLNVRGRTRLAMLGLVEPRLEVVERVVMPTQMSSKPSRRQAATRALVREEHLEAQVLRAARARVCSALPEQRLGDALAPGARLDVHELDVRAAVRRSLDAGDTDRSLLVLGDEDTAARRDSSRMSVHSSSHVSGSPTGAGTSRSNSSQNSRRIASSASVARRIVTARSAMPVSR